MFSNRVPGIDAIGNIRVNENVEDPSTVNDEADASWEADMEQKDVVADQLFGLRISTPARTGGTSPYRWTGSPANWFRQQSPQAPSTVDSSPSAWSTSSSANSELAVAGPQVLFSF